MAKIDQDVWKQVVSNFVAANGLKNSALITLVNSTALRAYYSMVKKICLAEGNMSPKDLLKYYHGPTQAEYVYTQVEQESVLINEDSLTLTYAQLKKLLDKNLIHGRLRYFGVEREVKEGTSFSECFISEIVKIIRKKGFQITEKCISINNIHAELMDELKMMLAYQRSLHLALVQPNLLVDYLHIPHTLSLLLYEPILVPLAKPIPTQCLVARSFDEQLTQIIRNVKTERISVDFRNFSNTIRDLQTDAFTNVTELYFWKGIIPPDVMHFVDANFHNLREFYLKFEEDVQELHRLVAKDVNVKIKMAFLFEINPQWPDDAKRRSFEEFLVLMNSLAYKNLKSNHDWQEGFVYQGQHVRPENVLVRAAEILKNGGVEYISRLEAANFSFNLSLKIYCQDF